MKKNDLILILFILISALGGFLFYRSTAKLEAGQVVITIDGSEYKRLPLDKDQELTIPGFKGGTNHLVIRGGFAEVTEASCPDKVCVHQAAISKNGEIIVCLPNRVVVSVVGAEDANLDGIAN